MLRVVMDTNVLLIAVSPFSPYHWIIDDLENGKYTLCVTTDILLEYTEIIERHMGSEVANLAVDALLQLPNLVMIEKYFFWQLIPNDPDDNKFIDCAIAASAKYIVSEDRHFRVLKTNEFFTSEVIDIPAFQSLLRGE